MEIKIPSEKLLSYLREYITLDASSKSFLRWIKSPGTRCKAGDEAMTCLVSGKRYYGGKFKGEPFLAHRLVFYLHYGYWPLSIIDHKNGDRLCNNPENLRISTHSDNGANCISKGYYWSDEKSCWESQIKKGSKTYTKNLKTESEARTWYELKKAELYPHLSGDFQWTLEGEKHD